MKVLITGATGFLGKHLVPKLGFCELVRCFVRKTSDISSIKLKNVEFCYGDIREKDALDKAMKDMDVVIHMVAVVFVKNKEDQYKVNVKGTQNVVDLCKKHKVKKLIYLSSVAVIYGKDHSNYGYSFTKKKAEEIVLKSNLNTIILRPSLIYGKGSRLTSILKIVRFLLLIPLPSYMFKKRIQQPVYIGDVINTIILALKTNKLKKNKPYFIAGPNSHTIAELIDKTTIYPFHPLKISIPSFLIKIIVWVYQKILPSTPINREHLSKQHKVYYFDIQDAINDFGYRPIDISDAIKIKED